ncbi:MAG: 4Fe-4S binding protein [Taibaiella sp.]|nr:4Fe-4S binding protein [Taibaiella sp.]
MSASDLSIAQPHPQGADAIQKIGLSLAALGLLVLLVAMAGVTFEQRTLFLSIALGGILVGTVVYASRKYMTQPAGIKNNGVMHKQLTNRGVFGWMIGIFLTGFYVLLYWFPYLFGTGDKTNTGLVALFDPLSNFLNGGKADEYFVYGSVYSLAVLSLGIKFMLKYRNNRYQFTRTLVVILIQLSFAYVIPEILKSLQRPDASFEMDIKNFWPLKFDFFDGDNLNAMRKNGGLGMLFLVAGVLGFTVLAPIITYFTGKRWYCSWVCGCGGLAETAGDSFRQLSSKKLVAWKIERWLIYSVLIFVVIMTAGVLYTYFSGKGEGVSGPLRSAYGFMIGSIFSGVIGVGFYPLMGNRVWCRFGCPMAAYIGLVQRFKSRFRITTNGGQCISCGNCSTYCEQGIDVRWYAQRGQNIVRSSCVGCGICSAVCPRGVLKLENGPEQGRINEDPLLIGLLKQNKD